MDRVATAPPDVGERAASQEISIGYVPREVCAALDLGTNNCRLLVARRAGRGFRIIDAFSRIVRLGEGIAQSGRLSEAAMDRTLAALAVCADKMARRKVTQARAVATEACRRAGNCEEFLERVRTQTGIPIEIIASDEEARLVVVGCAPLLDRRTPFALVLDIGGGSTELAWLRVPRDPRQAPHVLDFVSLPYGVVTLSDGYDGRAVTEEIYGTMVAEVRAALAPFERSNGIARRIESGAVQMLGSSGTVTTLAAIHLGLPRYNRVAVDGSSLSFAEVAAASRGVLAMDYAARVAHPCIGAERADLVLAGCAILEAVCALWPVGHVRVADRGLREGILQGLFARH
ncbi:MAG TPA: Ppx/GppA phosphatase family protein [Stellaceae bacterium]|nr:Ppx/GppA phosphatase family protein [Stellaceae bacterium]